MFPASVGPAVSVLLVPASSSLAGALLFSAALLPAANINRYDDPAAFDLDTSSRTVLDFETVRNACISIPGAEGLTVNNVNFNGGVSRATSSGPCSPPLTPWQGYVLATRLVIRQDAPAQAVAAVALPAGVMAVGFHVGINSDPVASPIQVTLATRGQRRTDLHRDGKTRRERRLPPRRTGVCGLYFEPGNLHSAIPCSRRHRQQSDPG